MHDLPHLVCRLLQVALEVVVHLVEKAATELLIEQIGWGRVSVPPPTHSLILDMGKQIKASELRVHFFCARHLQAP